MPNSSETFTTWLNEKLRELQTDPEIFGNYIIGILSEEESQEEKKEALQELLNEIIEQDLQSIVTSFIEKWQEYHTEETTVTKAPTVDVDAQLAKLLEAQKILPVVQERKLTEEERRIKEQILAQYSQTEVQEEDDYENGLNEGVEQHSAASTASSIERNTNVEDVLQLHKDRREQARLDSAAKKQKDKDDREKQRQMREEKKEKRKTVKGERRR